MATVTHITADYDAEAHAFYVTLGVGAVARTVEHEGINVDVDADGQPVGLEIIGPRTMAEIGNVVERYELLDALGQIAAALADAIVLPTVATTTPIPMVVTRGDYEQMNASPGSVSLGVPPRELEPA